MMKRWNMAQKNNIRSIRFSDDLAEMIDRQMGDTFTAKFENLITRCMWELPEKEKELERLEAQIQEKRKQLISMSQQVRELEASINGLFPKFRVLEDGVDRAVQKWKP
jgi:chromosome segregation ATPase